MGHDVEYVPLFETKRAKGSALYRLFAATIFVGICLVWAYRVSHVPAAGSGRLAWFGLFGSELWFGFYWVVTQSLRWNRVRRRTFRDRLSLRYHEKELPEVDIFVCTADPTIEPPMMVMNTVLSVMSYDHPAEKLAVYLSDDAGSDLTFYALLEASIFAKHWIPYCKRFKVEPRSPAAYLASVSQSLDSKQTKDLIAVKELYKQMEVRIESATKLGRVPEEERSKIAGFSQWESYSSKKDHDTILQIVIDGDDASDRDIEGKALPSLVYVAREKRPQHPHNFKAGAMNSLIRISSQISNAPIILNVDCDMYSNDSQSIRDALCFFMDEKQGQEIAFVQFPQVFMNITRNDVYGNSLRVIFGDEFYGFDGVGGPTYIGTGCFHRRDILLGKKFTKEVEIIGPWRKNHMEQKSKRSVEELEEQVKPLARCTYEHNTQWGDEMGLKYGCLVEDFATGLSIHCNGWKSTFLDPERGAFLGLAPTTLSQTLVQVKRWSEGFFQIFMSKFSPVWYGQGRISIGHQLGYLVYCLWIPSCFPTLYYSIVPSIYLLRGISLFPQYIDVAVMYYWDVGSYNIFGILPSDITYDDVTEIMGSNTDKVSSPWFIPFVYVVFAKYMYSLMEFLNSGGTLLGWWNEQRMWLYRRTTCFLFALIDTGLKLLGFADSAFVLTAKVADDEGTHRYEQEIIEFGASSPMFTVLAVLALLNLFFLVGVAKKAIMGELNFGVLAEDMALQVILCGVLVLINLPLYQGLFLRKDRGRMPSSVTVKSLGIAFVAYVSLSTFSS